MCKARLRIRQSACDKSILRCIGSILICIFLLLFATANVHAAERSEKIEVTLRMRAAAPREEFGIIWSTLRNMAFFRKHGYHVVLPDHDRFEQLSNSMSKNPDADKQELYELFVNRLYNKDGYEIGLKKLRQSEASVKKVFPVFDNFKRQWGYKVCERYDVVLTLYGPGGQYHPKTGKIFIKTTPDGQFKRIDPAHTIVHEMVHIGIDKTVIKKFKLTHWEKERVVDLVCYIMFNDILEDYNCQSKGDNRLDAYVDKNTIMSLPKAIESYVNQFPRSSRGNIGKSNKVGE